MGQLPCLRISTPFCYKGNTPPLDDAADEAVEYTPKSVKAAGVIRTVSAISQLSQSEDQLLSPSIVVNAIEQNVRRHTKSQPIPLAL